MQRKSDTDPHRQNGLTETGTPVRIWDIWVRIFHWSLAVSVLFLLISGNTGFQFFDWHRQAGEFVLALVLFRVLWGMAGSANARLSALPKSPRAALLHLKDLLRRHPDEERGHNAAGGWAVILMLLMITVQAATGLFIADEDELLEGALYGSVSGSLTDWMYQVHHMNAEFIQIVVLVHIAMVFAYWLLVRQNLVRPMITGVMTWTSSKRPPELFFQKAGVGLILAVLSLALTGYLLQWY